MSSVATNLMHAIKHQIAENEDLATWSRLPPEVRAEHAERARLWRVALEAVERAASKADGGAP